MRAFLVAILLQLSSFTYSQLILYQDTYQGGATGGGFSTGRGVGAGTVQLYIESGSTIRKAFLFAFSTFDAKDSLFINDTGFYFSAENRVSTFEHLSTFNSPQHLHMIDITQWLQNNTTSTFDIEVPHQQGLPYEGVFAPFLWIGYENNILPKVNTVIIGNNQNLFGNEIYNIANLSTIDNSKPVGFSLYSDRTGSQFIPNSIISFNSNLLGIVGGSDNVNNTWDFAGVKGHFYYQNNQLFGLDDDTPDTIMGETDGLADVSSYLPNNAISCNFQLTHIDYPAQVASRTNTNLAYFLTYTSPCDTFSVSVPSDTTVCYGEQLQLLASGGTSTGSTPTYEWSPSVGLSCSDCPNPVFTADSSMFYTIRIWNNDASAGSVTGCSVVRPLKINVRPQPQFGNITVMPTECGSSTGSLTATGSISTGSMTALAELFAVSENGDTTSVSGNMIAGLSAGNHTLFYTDTNGCQSADTIVTVHSVNNTVSDFTVTPQSGGAPLSVFVENASQNASHFQWSTSTGSVHQGITPPAYVFDTSGTYQIMLVAWQHDSLCADTAYATVLVYDSLMIHIPNVFTPNGDGVNDYFSITVNMPVHCDLVIVNRWGNEVYRFEGGLNPGINNLWDGFVTLFHGDLTDGVYFFQLTIKELTVDNCTLNNCQLKKDGFVTVVR